MSLATHRFDWRDLWVDTLFTPHAAPRILDRHEIPADTPPPLRAAIDTAVVRLLAEHQSVARYLQALLPTLRQRANFE